MYTAIVGVDNSVRILIDGEERKTASLLSKEDFSPPVNPPEEIDDPTDSKPADWVEDQMMDDPSATKPSEWDEDAPSQQQVARLVAFCVRTCHGPIVAAVPLKI